MSCWRDVISVTRISGHNIMKTNISMAWYKTAVNPLLRTGVNAVLHWAIDIEINYKRRLGDLPGETSLRGCATCTDHRFCYHSIHAIRWLHKFCRENESECDIHKIRQFSPFIEQYKLISYTVSLVRVQWWLMPDASVSERPGLLPVWKCDVPSTITTDESAYVSASTCTPESMSR